MQNAPRFRAKIARGQVCFGSYITCTDPTITEALSSFSDFVWIDTEHNALSLETVQGHLMALRAAATAGLVRVPWNDPVLIKPLLDLGADGVIVPFVRSAEEARRAVAACSYPPEGVRGYGPRRASDYGRLSGPEYCRLANESIICVVQIEHIDAVNCLDYILAVPGLTSIVVGPNDLAGSMGYMGQPTHPEVLKTIDTIIAKTLATPVWASVSIGGGAEEFAAWVRRGVQWITLGGDLGYMLSAARQLEAQVREHASRPD